jgi:transposase
MLSLPPSVAIWVCTVPVDMRKQHEGLCGVAMSVLGLDPMSGHVMLFFNRAHDRVKLLWWDRGGFALLYKRLERGTFQFPRAVHGKQSVKIDAGELGLILEGIDLRGARWRARWDPPAHQAHP